MPQSPFVELSPEEHRQRLAALRRARYGTHLSPGPPGLGTRRPRAASSTPAYHGAGPDAAPVAPIAAQGHAPDVGVVPYALEWCHPGPDAAGQAGSRGFGRDHAALAPRDRLGVETSETGRQGRCPVPGRA